MSVEYVKLSDYNIAFKQLISGPAPVGRILNYVKLAGEGKLFHTIGHRSLSLTGGTASAWCSEFTVGLGLLYYTEEKGKTKFPLLLTENGKKLYGLIKDFDKKFDEGADPKLCKLQLLNYSKPAYELFFKIFKASPVCINLCAYLRNNMALYYEKSEFKNDYFGFFKVHYEGGTYNGCGRTTAGDNRVPSILQLCEFFDCLKEENKHYYFNYAKLAENEDGYFFIPLDKKKTERIKKEQKRNERIVADLVKKYGIAGTVAREIVARNGTVQNLFRNNLIARYGCKCAVCEKNIEKVLIASHIIPSAESDVLEKADCENGLLLCALHDKLFDRYLISFDASTGKLMCSDEIKDKLEEYQLGENTVLEERFMTEERKKNLLKHNAAFNAKNKK